MGSLSLLPHFSRNKNFAWNQIWTLTCNSHNFHFWWIWHSSAVLCGPGLHRSKIPDFNEKRISFSLGELLILTQLRSAKWQGGLLLSVLLPTNQHPQDSKPAYTMLVPEEAAWKVTAPLFNGCSVISLKDKFKITLCSWMRWSSSLFYTRQNILGQVSP